MRTFDEEFERVAKSAGLLKKKLFMMVETQCKADGRDIDPNKKQELIGNLAQMRISQFVFAKKINEIVIWINGYEKLHGKLELDFNEEEFYDVDELLR